MLKRQEMEDGEYMAEPKGVSLTKFIETKFNDFEKRMMEQFSFSEKRFNSLENKLTSIDIKFNNEHDNVLSAERDISDATDKIIALGRRMTDCQIDHSRRKGEIEDFMTLKIKEMKATGIATISWKALAISGSIILLLIGGLVYSYKTFFMTPILEHIQKDSSIQQEIIK